MAISQAKLIQAARRVFAQDGYKAASIVEIAQVAGIAVGGVYLLYPSKLELFLAVYRAEDEKTKNRIVGRIDWSQPRAAFAAYLRATTQATRRNKILAEWQSDVPGEQVRQAYHDNAKQAGAGHSLAMRGEFFAEQVQQWRRDGRLRPGATDQIISELFTAVAAIDALEGIAPKTMRFMVDAVLEQLFVSE
jgi:hypothetical protein